MSDAWAATFSVPAAVDAANLNGDGASLVRREENDRQPLYASLPAFHVSSHLADVGLKVDFERVAFGL
jgi:hypothetical protein